LEAYDIPHILTKNIAEVTPFPLGAKTHRNDRPRDSVVECEAC